MEEISNTIEAVHFGDHHRYRAKDIKRIANRFKELPGEEKLIITTEKDAVKLTEIKEIPGEIAAKLFYFPLEVEFRHNDKNDFNQSIFKYVETNKRHNSLFKQ